MFKYILGLFSVFGMVQALGFYFHYLGTGSLSLPMHPIVVLIIAMVTLFVCSLYVVIVGNEKIS